MPVVKPLFELAALDAVSWMRELPTESVDLVVTDPAYESLEKHRAVGTTTQAEAQQVIEQRLVSRLPELAIRRAVRRSVSRAQARHALLPVLRRRDDVRCQAGSRTGGLQVLEAAGVGQEHDRHGLSLPRALRVHPVFREGQAPIERPRRGRHHHPAAHPSRVSSRKAGRGFGGRHRPELAGRRCRGRSRSWDRAASASPR